MEQEFGLRTAGQDILNAFSKSFATLLPRLFIAIVVIFVGLALAKLIQRVLVATLNRVRFEKLLDQLGVSRAFRFVGIQKAPIPTIALITYYFLVILVVQTAFKTVGLDIVSEAIGSFFDYVPNLLAAAVVLLLGNAIGQFAGKAVAQSSASSGVDYATLLGRIVTGAILIMAAVMALSQLEFNTVLIQIVAGVLLGGFILSFALSFGLGTRDITRNIVAGFYARKIFQPGDEIEIRGQRSVLRAITPVQTVLERDEKIVTISNWGFIEEKVER